MFDFEAFPELEELKSIRMDTSRMVVDSLREGIKDGTVRKDIDPVKTTMIMTSSMISVLTLTPVMDMLLKSNELTHEELIDYATGMMLRSIENVK